MTNRKTLMSINNDLVPERAILLNGMNFLIILYKYIDKKKILIYNNSATKNSCKQNEVQDEQKRKTYSKAERNAKRFYI